MQSVFTEHNDICCQVSKNNYEVTSRAKCKELWDTVATYSILAQPETIVTKCLFRCLNLQYHTLSCIVYNIGLAYFQVDILYEWHNNLCEKLLIRINDNYYYLHGYSPMHPIQKTLLIIVIRSLFLSGTAYDLNVTSSVPKIDTTLYILQNICWYGGIY